VAPDPIPPTIVEFVRRTFESVRQLELLLMLRAEPSRAWTATEMSVELRSSETGTANHLADLQVKGLLARHDGPDGAAAYRYAPDQAVERTVSALAEVFGRRKQSVVRLIFSEPEENPIQTFADAFRIRRDG
jgi:hypothetical protein